MHNLVNLGYLSVRGDCFYIMKCVHSKSNPRQIPGRQTESHLPACSCHEPTLTRMHSHTYTHITHAKLASQSEPRLSSTNMAFSTETLHTSGPTAPLPPSFPHGKALEKKNQGLQFCVWKHNMILHTWIKSRNVRGSKSSICPMSLEKRFKILPANTGYEKLCISPDRPFKRKTCKQIKTIF